MSWRLGRVVPSIPTRIASTRSFIAASKARLTSKALRISNRLACKFKGLAADSTSFHCFWTAEFLKSPKNAIRFILGRSSFNRPSRFVSDSVVKESMPERTKQQNLVITKQDEPTVTVDNIE